MKRALIAFPVLVTLAPWAAPVGAATPSPDALLSDGDRRHQEQAVQNALEFNRTGEAEIWENPETGHHGRVTPTLTYRDSAGQDCRKFERELTIDGREAEARSARCRTAAGVWLRPVAPKPIYTRRHDDPWRHYHHRRHYPYHGSYWYYPPVSVHLFYEFGRHRHKIGRHRRHHRHGHRHLRSDHRHGPHRHHRR